MLAAAGLGPALAPANIFPAHFGGWLRTTPPRFRQAFAKPRLVGPILVACLLAIGAAPAAHATKPTRPRADLQVEVSAPRNILPVFSGWTRVSTTVRNLGTAPASSVRLTITPPAQLQVSQLSTIDEWDCGTAPVDLLMQSFEAAVGQNVAVQAEATTSSRECDLTNNTAAATVTFVGTGLITGRMWNDLNANGSREAGEPYVSTQIAFRAVDDEDDYGVANPYNGMFDFTVPAKRFYGEVRVRTTRWGFTTPNVGDDSTDSDFTQVSDDGYYRTARTAEFVVEGGPCIRLRCSARPTAAASAAPA